MSELDKMFGGNPIKKIDKIAELVTKPIKDLKVNEYVSIFHFYDELNKSK